MSEKPANQDLSQGLLNLVNGSSLNTIYEQFIDASLTQFGRDVTFHLQPGKNLTAPNAKNYNAFGGGQDPRILNDNKGVVISPIFVRYRAHIKHGPVLLDNENSIQLDKNEVSLTTVYESLSDISKCIEAEIDGSRFVLSHGPRPIGFGVPKYIISIWSKKIDNA